MEPIEHLYLHVPFCTWVCKYCDFTAYPVLQGMIPSYLAALEDEVRAAAATHPLGPLKTVFLGGGTPSLLDGAQVGRLLARVNECCGVRRDAEVTLEANPGTVTAAAAAGWPTSSGSPICCAPPRRALFYCAPLQCNSAAGGPNCN